MAKLAKKAMDARKKMSALTAAGVSNSVGVLVNGLYEVLQVEINKEELTSRLPFLTKLGDDDLNILLKRIEKDFLEAHKSARQELEKQLSQNTNIDDLKGLLSD